MLIRYYATNLNDVRLVYFIARWNYFLENDFLGRITLVSSDKPVGFLFRLKHPQKNKWAQKLVFFSFPYTWDTVKPPVKQMILIMLPFARDPTHYSNSVARKLFLTLFKLKLNSRTKIMAGHHWERRLQRRLIKAKLFEKKS